MNRNLANMKNYIGHISDVDLSLYRGAYRVYDIYLDKLDSTKKDHTRFFNSKAIDLSIEWKSLLKGSIVGELVFENPALYFTKDKTELREVRKDTSDFRNIIDALMPLRINRLEIQYGEIHYIDENSIPKVDIKMENVSILAENLSNVINKYIELPSTVLVQANVYEGNLNLEMKLNALAKSPAFDLDAEIRNMNLVLLNDFLQAYGNFDVNKGSFGLFSEMAAENGKFKGYVKPIIHDLDVVGPEDKKDNFLQRSWESIVGAFGFVFKNQEKDQLATKIPMEGNFKNPDTDKIEAIWEVLKNAFIEALIPSIDHQISIQSVHKNATNVDHSTFRKFYTQNNEKKMQQSKNSKY